MDLGGMRGRIGLRMVVTSSPRSGRSLPPSSLHSCPGAKLYHLRGLRLATDERGDMIANSVRRIDQQTIYGFNI